MGKEIREISREHKDSVVFADEGYPVQDCDVRICDDRDLPVCDGIVGQIQIRGKNVTKRYYNNQKATREAFTSDGWLRTGDLGFFRNGRLIVTGRLKDIIFINGQNYYPHDLERIIENIEGVETGRVVVCGVYNYEKQEDEVVVFLRYKNHLETFIPFIRSIKKLILNQTGLEVREVLPIKSIPKTTSGKVQRYKLVEEYQKGNFKSITQELEVYLNLSNDKDSNLLAPRTNTERKLLDILKEILNVSEMGIHDNLFELGVNSLKVIAIHSRILEEFRVEIPLNSLFENINIEQLANFIDKSSNNSEKVDHEQQVLVTTMNQTFIAPVLPSQHRLFVMEQLEGVGTSNHIAYAFKLTGEIDKDLIEQAINKLMIKHEVLRTTFHINKNSSNVFMNLLILMLNLLNVN
jgi:acyl carrier protein